MACEKMKDDLPQTISALPTYSFPMSDSHMSSSAMLSAAVGAAGVIPPPSSPSREDRHRFYQCVLEPLHVTCKPIDIDRLEMHTIRPGVTTMIMHVESWIPSIADRSIIRWRLFEKRKLTFEDPAPNTPPS